MRRVVFGDPAVAEYVAWMAQCAYHKTDVCSGVVDDSLPPASRVRGGVIFTSYTGASLWMHVAGRDERWITKDMLWVAFHYPFVQLGCGRVFGVVEAANSPALEFDLKLGFRITATLPGMFASGPGLVVSMARDECRWLTLKPRSVKEGAGDGWEREQGSAAA